MYIVSLRYQKTYNLKEVKDSLGKILSESWGKFSSLRRGDLILLKPNLLSAKAPKTAVITHPIVLEALIQLLLDKGCKIILGDSPAIQRFTTVAKKAGLLPLQKRYSVRLQELDDPVEVKGIKNGIFKSFEISRHCLESNYFINVAKFKTHSMMGLTLCVKNLFGCVPGKKKTAWHLAIGKDRKLFARMLSELAAVLPVDFNVIDGIVGMEGNGPGNGTPVNLNVLLGGENAAAIDTVAGRIVGISPNKSLTSRAAIEIDFGPKNEEEISILGDRLPNHPFPFRFPETMRTDWHLPSVFKSLLRWAFLPLPKVDSARCKGCLNCKVVCPPGAIFVKDGKVSIKERLCIRCYCCQEVCPEDAILFTRKTGRKDVKYNLF